MHHRVHPYISNGDVTTVNPDYHNPEVAKYFFDPIDGKTLPIEELPKAPRQADRVIVARYCDAEKQHLVPQTIRLEGNRGPVDIINPEWVDPEIARYEEFVQFTERPVQDLSE